jgi:photosystem II stability/assembly factor-like uncharacterized protein
MDEQLFHSLEWRCLGPHRGGRVVAVAGHPSAPGTFYFGACAGGVWKTTNGGSHWENVSDGFFGTAAVGALAVAPSQPEIVYVGTGEATIRGNVSHGDGVYRSSDGGRSWRHLGLRETRHIGDLVIHPTNPDLVYVAAFGHAWGPNEERGVFRTTDGGQTWERVLYRSARAGCTDLAMDPHHPEVLYANLWQAQRYPHAMHSGGEDSGIWRSTEAGATWTWTELTHNKGLPKGLLGKVGLAASPAQAGRVWALIEAKGEDGQDAGGLYRSDDWGENWQRINSDMNLRRRPFYYMHVIADPQDAETMWVLNVQCWKSVDGGKTFDVTPTPHGDNHALWIDPRDSRRRIQGDDGGAYVTFDDGRHWSSIYNQPTAQFYHVTTDDAVPYYVYGSQQDNWPMRLPSMSMEGAITWGDYVEPGGGESGYIAISGRSTAGSRVPPYTVFGGAIGNGPGHGRLTAWDSATGQKRNITVWPEVEGNGVGAETHKYRFQWTFPLEVSPHDPRMLYACSNVVHRSTDEGTSWQVLSPDLTRHDPSTLGASGGPITADNSGAEVYGTIFAFRESPHEAGVFWAGSDDGLVYGSRDGGASWQDITPPDLPPWALISVLEPSPHDAATCYLAATRYQLDDLTPYLYRTDDYGASWQRITAGMPAHEFTRVIRADPARRGLLYAGTETGVYVSFDDGGHWQRFQGNLPVAPIHDLAIKGSDLLAATHGRSLWILDDLSPLHQLDETTVGADVKLFAPRPVIRYRTYSYPPGGGPAGYADYKGIGSFMVAVQMAEAPDGTKAEHLLDAGKNPPSGVIVHYYLKQVPEKPVTLRFLDAGGAVLRSFTSDAKDPPHVPVRAGANRFVWDLRGGRPTKLESPKPSGPYSEVEEAEAGVAPWVLPGEYAVELIVDGPTASGLAADGSGPPAFPPSVHRERFTVCRDPRLAVSDEDLRAQFELKTAIRDRVSQVHEAVNALRRVRGQIEGWVARAQVDDQRARLSAAAVPLKEQLTAIEGALINVDAEKPQPGRNRLEEKLIALSGLIDESDHAPTQGAREVFAKLDAQCQEQREALRRVLEEDVRAFNELVRALDVPPVGP